MARFRVLNSHFRNVRNFNKQHFLLTLVQILGVPRGYDGSVIVTSNIAKTTLVVCQGNKKIAILKKSIIEK